MNKTGWMSGNTERVYKFIEYLCTTCNAYDDKNNKLSCVPVMITKKDVADKLCLSEKTIERNINMLIRHHNIYRYSYNNNYIYNLEPLDMSNDILIRIRLFNVNNVSG